MERGLRVCVSSRSVDPAAGIPRSGRLGACPVLTGTLAAPPSTSPVGRPAMLREMFVDVNGSFRKGSDADSAIGSLSNGNDATGDKSGSSSNVDRSSCNSDGVLARIETCGLGTNDCCATGAGLISASTETCFATVFGDFVSDVGLES